MSEVKSVIKSLGSLSLPDLKKVMEACEAQIVETQKKEKAETLRMMRELAESKGVDFEEIVQELGGAKKDKSRNGNLPPKFRHPEDPSKTWSGRGRKPQWLRDLEAQGHSADEYKV